MHLVESDTLAATFIFWSTIDEVDRNHIIVGDRLYELKALQDSSKKLDVILFIKYYLLKVYRYMKQTWSNKIIEKRGSRNKK